MLKVYLVHDSDRGWHHSKCLERVLTPFEKLVALQVAFEFDFQVLGKCLRRTRPVHLNGMIHHQVDRNQGLNYRRIVTQSIDRIAHRRQVDQKRHPCKIL